MINIKNKDYRDILHLIYQADSCENTEGFIRSVLPEVARMFHCECVTFQLVGGCSGKIRILESRSFKAISHDLIEDGYFPGLYKDDFYRYSPLLKDAIKSQANVLKIGDSISFAEWEKSLMYQNFILPQHLYWELFLALRYKGDLQGMITLWRDHKYADFETAEMSKAEILVPGLGLALYNICYKSLINSWKKRLVELGENSEEGILLLDDKLKIHYFNLKAAEICRILIGRKNENRLDRENTDFPVPSCIIRDCVNLINMLRMTNQPIVWPKERIIFDDYGHQFRIECSIIWKSDQLNAIRPYFMVSLIDLKNENNTTNKFNLTKRESDVLYCMVRGLSYNEIAEKLFISKLTVHTHVKNIYRKLGIKNKIELIRNIQSPTWVL